MTMPKIKRLTGVGSRDDRNMFGSATWMVMEALRRVQRGINPDAREAYEELIVACQDMCATAPGHVAFDVLDGAIGYDNFLQGE